MPKISSISVQPSLHNTVGDKQTNTHTQTQAVAIPSLAWCWSRVYVFCCSSSNRPVAAHTRVECR